MTIKQSFTLRELARATEEAIKTNQVSLEDGLWAMAAGARYCHVDLWCTYENWNIALNEMRNTELENYIFPEPRETT